MVCVFVSLIDELVIIVYFIVILYKKIYKLNNLKFLYNYDMVILFNISSKFENNVIVFFNIIINDL